MENSDLQVSLQKGLEAECQKLHRGEAIQIVLAPASLDANTTHEIRAIFERMYETIFKEELQIEKLYRTDDGILHMTIAKKTHNE